MAELVIFQKNDEKLDFLKYRLELFPRHRIVYEAHTLLESLNLLETIKSEQIEGHKIPDAIVLDGNFSTNTYPCSDAIEILDKRNILNLTIHAIGYSTVFLAQHTDNLIHPGLDIRKNPNDLLRVLNEIFK